MPVVADANLPDGTKCSLIVESEVISTNTSASPRFLQMMEKLLTKLYNYSQQGAVMRLLASENNSQNTQHKDT